MRLVEKITKKHIYLDDETGEQYVFDGEKLVSIGKAPPIETGASGDVDFDELEKQHQARLEQERKEHPEWHKDDAEDSYEDTEEAQAKRAERIKDIFSDRSYVKGIEKDIKALKDYEKFERQSAIEAEKSANTYKSPLEAFQEDIEDFVGEQVEKVREYSWKAENQRYSGTGIVRRGKIRVDNETVPLINVYFDQSRSWEEEDLAVGREAIGVLNNYVDEGLIDIDVYYFANHIHSTPEPARAEGGTGAGREILQHIIDTEPTNVVVMTDADMNYQFDNAPYVTVPGAVWYMFKDFDCDNMEKHLQGDEVTKVFRF